MKNTTHDPDWQRLEQLWHEHDKRVEQIAHPQQARKSTLVPHWRRFVAAVVCVVFAATSVLVYLHLQRPKPSDPMLAENQHENTSTWVISHQEDPVPNAEESEIVSYRKKHQAQDPSSELVPSMAEQQNESDQVKEHEEGMMSIPSDDSFLASTTDGQLSYVRCNNRCDAQEILIQIKESL